MREVLDVEIRRNIYRLIVLNPGINLTKIAEILRISIPLADYHLHYLEENALITSTKEGGYKRYYGKGDIGVEEKKFLSILQQDIPLQIVTFLLEHPYSKPRDILEGIHLSSALLTYYLKKLMKYGLVTENPRGEKKEFALVNEQQMESLLIRYKPNALLKRFKDSWTVDFPLSSKEPKKGTKKDSTDNQ